MLGSKRKPIKRGQGINNTKSAEESETEINQQSSSQNRERRSPSVLSEDIDNEENTQDSNANDFTRKSNINATKRSQRQQKTPNKRSKKQKHAEFQSNVPWPEHFIQLEKVFKSLNTVYTFISARKHMIPSFENMKKSVEGLLKRPIEIKDIVQLKSLLPDIIKFAYVDKEILESHVTKSLSAATTDSKRHQDENLFRLPATSDAQNQQEHQHVLVFEFTDGDAKPDQNNTSSTSSSNTSTNSMTKLINRRNSKFTDAVNVLLLASESHSVDPVKLLLDAAQEHTPVDPYNKEDVVQQRLDRQDAEFYIQNPQSRPSIPSIISELCQQEFYKDQIVQGGYRSIEAKSAKFANNTNLGISQNIMDALYETKGIKELYSHQAQAIEHLNQGQNVIVCTSTSSGKSLIYQIPALTALEHDPASTSLYIFPTKALAQDQKRSLMQFATAATTNASKSPLVSTFDGDTPKDEREHIRKNSSFIFTNPDMLHITILPNEENWRDFFANLKFVVVDELHIYTGLFGCHVAWIMRRLRRICNALGNNHVKFVSCSATIANPQEHMETLFGIKDVHVVSEDGSPSGAKEHIVWNAPFIDPRNVTQGRVSTFTEGSRVIRFLMDRGLRIIAFCKMRKACEILVKTIREDLFEQGRQNAALKVMAYRSGYSPEDRRRIEAEMFRGDLLVIVATTALELGIDIGSLDAVITVGFPWTLAGLRQQSGRAGRRNKDSLSMLMCDPLPHDQHYAKHPQEIFTKPEASINLSLDNSIVLEGHLQCAADELPIQIDVDKDYFGENNLTDICKNKLIQDDEGFFHCHPRCKPNPAKNLNIRNIEDDVYTVIDCTNNKDAILEDIEWSRAIFELYEGSVFMHQGQTFIVQNITHTSKIASLIRANVQWTTKQRDYTDVDAIASLRIREIQGSENYAYYGDVQITSVVFGYYKVDRRQKILDTVDVDTPPFIRYTHGLWIDVPQNALDILSQKNINVAASIHAASHALLSLTPIFVMTSVGEVRTECKAPEKEFSEKLSQRKRPARITLYDTAGKNGGVCARIFDHIGPLVKHAADAIANCNCSEGCPECIASTVCSEGNIVCSKIGARVVLESIRGKEIDIDSIPQQDNPQERPSTIVNYTGQPRFLGRSSDADT